MNQTTSQIAWLNLFFNNIPYFTIDSKDSIELAEEELQARDIIMCQPPFGVKSNFALSPLYPVETKSGDLLFLQQVLLRLKPGGKAAIILPRGTISSGVKAYAETKKLLVAGEYQLEAVISLPRAIFSPGTSMETSILLIKRLERDETRQEKVWFYQLKDDGYSKDRYRRKLKTTPLPEAVTAWHNRESNTKQTDRKGNHFFVPVAEIIKADMDLSFSRYQEFEYEQIDYEPTDKILRKLKDLEEDIKVEMENLNKLYR